MTCDYDAIRRENELRYGTDIGRIGPMLLANRYDDRTHFIYELLQNAEDALARRLNWQGSRTVSFHLNKEVLRFTHSGEPFNEKDVRGICGIDEGTKNLTEIGRFGIGFKSVYAFTDRPEIHSGIENFAVESFVWPIASQPIPRDGNETIILIPLRAGDSAGHDEIASGLSRLGARALLFLRQINEIRWRVEGEGTGIYLRVTRELAPDVRRVTVIGREEGRSEVEEEWLVFSKMVATPEGQDAGYVEIAWSVTTLDGHEHARPIKQSPLVVFFPTIRETHLGLLIQGPYRTTPSRDNVPPGDKWNQSCVKATAELVIEALRWLRDQGLLDTEVLKCLPFDRSKFPEGSMFTPLFEGTRDAFVKEALLPCYESGYASAVDIRLARTQNLRNLLEPDQLGTLYGEGKPLNWLVADISHDRTPELRQYFIDELEIPEITPENFLSKLNAEFLQAQSDEWILRLYEFLNDQVFMRSRAAAVALIRLSDGSHVLAKVDDKPEAFLPSQFETGFPTVRRAVCQSEAAVEFLRSLGLTEPDPVDDIVWNVLPKFEDRETAIPMAEYESDISRILVAFGTDSKTQRDKLIEKLREIPFVVAIDAGQGGSQICARPGEVYIATERLQELFRGIQDILIVDSGVTCLRGEEIRELLEACGAVRYPRPEKVASLSWDERRKLREHAGHAETSGRKDQIDDRTLLGLEAILNYLPKLDVEDRRNRTRLLWEELTNLEERRGKGIFSGEYTWTHRGSYRATFDAAFVRKLNMSSWVPDKIGNLKQPAFILFDSLDWKLNPFIQSKIRFKPPALDCLAKEAGIEPGILGLLKELGVTSEAELRKRLGIFDEMKPDDAPTGSGITQQTILPERGSVPQDGVLSGDGVGGGGRHRTGAHFGDGRKPGDGEHTIDRAEGRHFVTYVATHPDDEGPDPDGLDQSARMSLEEKAIDLILTREPDWQRTPPNNPGFDLFKPGSDGKPVIWCEVKAMTRTLDDRPVGLSCTQFDCAREHGEAFWLYVVERANEDNAGIVRIQNPVGKARTFTFDRGWRALSTTDTDPAQEED